MIQGELPDARQKTPNKEQSPGETLTPVRPPPGKISPMMHPEKRQPCIVCVQEMLTDVIL